jgi:galactose-1-phosphate uridylyltransferase
MPHPVEFFHNLLSDISNDRKHCLAICEQPELHLKLGEMTIEESAKQVVQY